MHATHAYARLCAARRAAGSLSGGNQRRLGVAAALVADRPVLLLDEPSSGMDPGEDRTPGHGQGRPRAPDCMRALPLPMRQPGMQAPCFLMCLGPPRCSMQALGVRCGA